MKPKRSPTDFNMTKTFALFLFAVASFFYLKAILLTGLLLYTIVFKKYSLFNTH